MKILVCEDDLMMIKAIEHKLLQDRYEVVVAQDGKAASEQIRSQEFDIIITDLLMPYMNGLELVDLIRNQLRKTTPVIVFSKLGNEDTILEALKTGANDYLAKPFKPNELAIRIKNQLQKTQLAPPPAAAFAASQPGYVANPQMAPSIQHKAPVVSDWAYMIMRELANMTIPVSETLQKVQTLTMYDRVNNPELRDFVESELNGFRWNNVPDYRTVETTVYGNFIDNRGFGMYASRNNIEIPPDYFRDDIRDHVMKARITSPVSELEKIVKSGDDYLIPLPHFIVTEIARNLDRGWQVDALWQKIDRYSLEKILSAVRITLTDVMLKMEQDNEKIETLIEEKVTEMETFLRKKPSRNINDLLDASISKFRDKEKQIRRDFDPTAPRSPQSPVQPSSMQTEPQNEKTRQDLLRFVSELGQNMEDLGLKEMQKSALIQEIQRIESQLTGARIRPQVISEALNSINSILHTGS